MKQEPLILTFDFGTQSVRASIFDAKGECVAFTQEKYNPAYESPKPGHAELDPNYYYGCLCKCTKELAKNHAELLKQCKGISLSCFRDTAVLLDKNNNVVRPTILWLDQRMAKCEDKLPLLSRAAFALVGMSEVIRVNRKRTAFNWIKENEPENYKKTAKYIAISTYFILKLTGKMVDSPSSYTGHYPIEYKKRAWYKNVEKHMQGSIFSVKQSQLCELVQGGQICGTITKEAAAETGLPEGLVLYAGGSDKSCETLGTGVIDTSMAAISLGTACTIETSTEKYVEPIPLLPAYPSVLPNLYNMDFQIYRGLWMINWFLKEFGGRQIDDLVVTESNPEDFNKHLLEIEPGCNGLFVQPYWGPLLDRPAVKGSIVGFTDSTTIYHVYKAIIEGIGYELRAARDSFEKQLKKKTFKEIRISGGGAKSDAICQIMADIMNLPVTKIQTIEASSLGAAISGFMAIGLYKDAGEAVKAMVHPAKTFQPDPERVKVYDLLFKSVYVKLYGSLKKVYQFIYDYQLKKI